MVETTESDSPLRPNPPYPEARMVKSPDWVFRKDIGIESVNTVELLTCKLDARVYRKSVLLKMASRLAVQTLFSMKIQKKNS